MKPSDARFIAQEVRGKGCRGCLFADERASVCYEVERVAKLASMPLCEYPSRPGHSIIYVLPVVDPRQPDLF